jgi:hypothetical protein
LWFARVLEDVAGYYGLRTQRIIEAEVVRQGMDLLIYEHGRHVAVERFPEKTTRVTHIVRDPRDMVVSGYYYHQWCEEKWATDPWDDRYNGRSYRDVLRGLSQDEGLAEEIRICSELTFPGMSSEKWARPNVLEIRYEDLVANEDALFAQVFRHYGFGDAATALALTRARAFTFTRVTGRPLGSAAAGQHLRSGAPGAWRGLLNKDHQRLLEDLNPGLLAALRYDLSVDATGRQARNGSSPS